MNIFKICLLSAAILFLQNQVPSWADDTSPDAPASAENGPPTTTDSSSMNPNEQNSDDATAAASAPDNPADVEAYSGDLGTLENQLFHANFASESMQSRLDRIERLIYGTAKSGTVAERMKELLTDVHMQAPTASPPASSEPVAAAPSSAPDAPSQNTQNYETQSEQPESSQGSQSYYYPSQNAAAGANGYQNSAQANSMTGQATIKGPQKSSSLKAEVSAMEMQVYQKTYNDSLNNRVARLEQTVFANQPPQHFSSLPLRINNLASALQPAFAHPQNLYESTPVLATSKESKKSEEEKQKNGHPFLKKLGAELARGAMMAGSMAGSMAVSSMMNGGYSNGYGGYGGGYGGYGGGYGNYGGYGGYPPFGGVSNFSGLAGMHF